MNRAGTYIQNMTGEAAYHSFRPTPLPPEPVVEWDNDIVNNLIDATNYLSKLNTAAELIPNAELFISMYVRKEALMSSQIEGTQFYE